MWCVPAVLGHTFFVVNFKHKRSIRRNANHNCTSDVRTSNPLRYLVFKRLDTQGSDGMRCQALWVAHQEVEVGGMKSWYLYFELLEFLFLFLLRH